MNNFIPYKCESITPSDLSSKNILMIGRGDDPVKRFDMGLKAMPYIIKEIPECQMIIISEPIQNLKNLVSELQLENNVKFVGYTSNPEIYYKNASLHIFPTLAEAFPNILSETLCYGIPNILTGLDYVTASKKGSLITYDDSPLSIANLAIKILKNKKYRKKLGNEARNYIKQFRNELILEKWIKVILSIYKGDHFYEEMRKKEQTIKKYDALKIIRNQIKLLKERRKEFEKITIKEIENLTFMENLK